MVEDFLIYINLILFNLVKKIESDLDVVSVDADSTLKTDKSSTDNNEKSGAFITKNKSVPKDEKPAVSCSSILGPEVFFYFLFYLQVLLFDVSQDQN